MKGGLAVQSYGWNMLRPLGDMQSVLKSLDEYGCDEISILRYARGNVNCEQLASDIAILKNCRTTSPVSFGGGISQDKHLELVREAPIERIIFSSSAIIGDFDLIESAAIKFGHQAIQCLLPMRCRNGQYEVFISSEKRFVLIKSINLEYIKTICNELIIYDTDADGYFDEFSFELLKPISFPKNRLILTGGIGKNIITRAKEEGIASVLIENRVLHRENSIKELRKHGSL